MRGCHQFRAEHSQHIDDESCSLETGDMTSTDISVNNSDFTRVIPYAVNELHGAVILEKLTVTQAIKKFPVS